MLQLPPSGVRTPISPWTADDNPEILRTKAIEFHCPTLVNTSYNQDGKQSGGSIASVPITKDRGQVEVWQAGYDNSLPISYHGGAIRS